MRTLNKGLMVIVGLIAVTTAALALIGAQSSPVVGATLPAQVDDGRVSVTTKVSQDKLLIGSDGQVAMEVTLAAAPMEISTDMPDQPVDLVIVIDRSGSMQGEKIAAARSAVRQLLDRLTAKDRLGLVTYSDGVQVMAPLTSMDGRHHNELANMVARIRAGGGTNLGSGLNQGIELLKRQPADGRQRKVILISDGLANQGITDPNALGQMAATATDHHFAVSTVGVGLEFNELLMTTIADHGLGQYYFLEDPLVFAQVFEKEFQSARQVAASDVVLRILLADGVQLINAGGYPIRMENGDAVVRPGHLISGQERKLFLTFRVPADQERQYPIGGVKLAYQRDGSEHTLAPTKTSVLACIADPKAVMASVDKDTWSEHVLKESYNQLKEEVADALRRGEAEEAESHIQAYAAEKKRINAAVGSAEVSQHLDEDVQALRATVADTFAGPPAAVAAKKKQNAKALQYESYQQRRSKY